MTNYEKRVAAKEIAPLNGMDALMIQMTVEDLIKGKDTLDNELHDLLLELKDEVDYLYKDEPDMLVALKKLMDDFTIQLVDTFNSATGTQQSFTDARKPVINDAIIQPPVDEAKVKEAEEYSKQWGGLPPGWQERLNELLHNHPAK